ncbi:MAG: ROK family transcriptional regulator [Coprobacillaceae bacterium]
MYKSKGAHELSVQQVKDYFINYKYAVKSEIAEETKLSQATITSILKELQENKYIERVEDCDSTGGRKAKRYKICGQYMCFGLIQLQVVKGQIKVNYRLIDLNEKVYLDKEILKKDFSLEKLLLLIQSMKNEYDFEYLGISIPAIVDNGLVTKSDIEAFENINLKKVIEDKISIKTVIENDVNTAMLGYIDSEAIEGQSIAFVYQPDNHHTGSGLYINNAIVYGATHFAGELAYLPNGSLEEQEKLLIEDPLALLKQQIQSIIAIVNPSHMIVYTFCTNQEELVTVLKEKIPTQHLPKFIFITTMQEYIFTGIRSLCIETSRFKL